MNIDNLEVGSIVSSYKKLCEILGIKVSQNKKIKDKNLKQLSKVVEFKQVNQANFTKFVIKELLYPIDEANKILSETSKRKRISEEEELIQNFLLCFLMVKQSGVALSRQRLYNVVGLVNKKYRESLQTRNKTIKEIDVCPKTFNKFIDSTNRSMRTLLENALNDLQKLKLVSWNYEMTICMPEEHERVATVVEQTRQSIDGDEYKTYEYDLKNTGIRKHYKKATDSERQWILYCEKSALIEMNVSTVQEVIAHGRHKEYLSMVINNIRERLPYVLYYYDSVNIIHNEEFTKKHLLEWSKEKGEWLRNEVNKSFMQRVEKNAKNRVGVESYGESDNSKELEDCIKISKKLVDLSIEG